MEVYFIIGVIVIQLYIFLKTWNKIRKFKNVILTKDQIEIKRSSFKNRENESEIIKVYQLKSEESNDQYSDTENAINDYLLHNKGATADMSLLKNIVERNVGKTENEIGALIPLPLYLGLIGTMAGIVIGLFQIPSVQETEFTDGFGIDVLIQGVKYAMIASLMGVFLTSLLSGFIFRNVKYKVEGRVNDFLTLLETKLLPVIKEEGLTNFYELTRNLQQFNNKFSLTVEDLQGIINKTYQSVVRQEKVFEAIQGSDINKLANVNIKVFQEMKQLMPQFELLGGYVAGVNVTFEKTTKLTENITSIIDRTNEVTSIASYISDSSNQAVKLNEIVEGYFEEIQERTNALKLAAVTMEDESKRTVEHFKEFIEEQIRSLRQVTVEEEDLMIKAFEKNRNVLDKLNELSEIKTELRSLNTNVIEKDSMVIKELNLSIGELNKSLNSFDFKRKSSNRQGLWGRFMSVINFIRK